MLCDAFKNFCTSDPSAELSCASPSADSLIPEIWRRSIAIIMGKRIYKCNQIKLNAVTNDSISGNKILCVTDERISSSLNTFKYEEI